MKELTAPWPEQQQEVLRLGTWASVVLMHYGQMKQRLAASAAIGSAWDAGKQAMDDYRIATSRFLDEQERTTRASAKE